MHIYIYISHHHVNTLKVVQRKADMAVQGCNSSYLESRGLGAERWDWTESSGPAWATGLLYS